MPIRIVIFLAMKRMEYLASPLYCYILRCNYHLRRHHLYKLCSQLTPWGRVTHICASKLTIIGSDKGLSPRRCRAIIWANAANKTLRNIFRWNFVRFKICHWIKRTWKYRLRNGGRPFCLGLSVLIPCLRCRFRFLSMLHPIKYRPAWLSFANALVVTNEEHR